MKYLPLYDYELSILTYYVSEIHSYFDDTLENTKNFPDGLKDMSDEVYQDYEYELKPLFNSSTFITIMSFVETSLDELCKNVKEEHKYKISLSDLSDRGIKRSLTYLSKVHGKENEIKSIHVEVNKFSIYTSIRNKMVHTNGVVLGNETKKIYQYQNEFPSLEILDYGFDENEIDEIKIRITQDFLVELLENVEILFLKIDKFV